MQLSKIIHELKSNKALSVETQAEYIQQALEKKLIADQLLVMFKTKAAQQNDELKKQILNKWLKIIFSPQMIEHLQLVRHYNTTMKKDDHTGQAALMLIKELSEFIPKDLSAKLVEFQTGQTVYVAP